MQQSAQGVGQGGQGGQGRGRAGQATRCWTKNALLSRPRLQPNSARWRPQAPPEGVPFCDHPQGEGPRVITLLGTSTGFEDRSHGCGEAGRRIGSLCAIEVEGLKRRPPTVGGRPMH